MYRIYVENVAIKLLGQVECGINGIYSDLSISSWFQTFFTGLLQDFLRQKSVVARQTAVIPCISPGRTSVYKYYLWLYPVYTYLFLIFHILIASDELFTSPTLLWSLNRETSCYFAQTCMSPCQTVILRN